MTAAHLRKGWCPGALRPMRSGDGLLVRVRPRAGSFSLAALRAVSAVAETFGSGEIDLTNRGNLQIRGVTEEGFERALATLDGAGLLDATAEAESVRNIVVDPLSGLDPAQVDVRELAAALEERLGSDPHLWALPGKFGFSFTGVASPQIGGRSADIMVAADGERYFIALEGARDTCSEVSRHVVVDAVHRLALAFVQLKTNDAELRRMRDAVVRLGAAAVFAMAGLEASTKQASGEVAAPVGVLTRNESVFGVGVGLPFGRITATQLGALCNAAANLDAQDFHTSPQRILVVTVSGAVQAMALCRDADAAGLITHADDIRLAMDVCPGSSACRNASTDTRRDAQRFAETFNGSLQGRSLHISGCEKGCARRGTASFTLVGRDGHYDMIKNGSADSINVSESINSDGIQAAISRLIIEAAI